MTTWTDDRVDRLKSLWLAGHSASQVARQLGGVTRNAVIGKVHRLGLCGRALPSAPNRLSRPRMERAVAAPRRAPLRAAPLPLVPVAAVASDPEPGEAHVPLLRLGACGCRYGFGDPLSDTFGFCSAPQVRGRYCARHAEIVFQPPSLARLKADRRFLEHVRWTG